MLIQSLDVTRSNGGEKVDALYVNSIAIKKDKHRVRILERLGI